MRSHAAKAITSALVGTATALVWAAAPAQAGPAHEEGYPSGGDIIGCAAVGPIDCGIAQANARDAEEAANELVADGVFAGDSLHNGKADAFRHCFWNALMVHYIGLDQAKIVANRHEANPDLPQDEVNMDLHNNMVGRDIGLQQTHDLEAQDECKWSALDGRLITLK
ncbi:DUF6973 domain-containing protein [Glycomyces dulcitolivorans]|uniref:DUF6973 domain-containing protein n=1 Tax=Glycomyces dulcitolivorans TaxID=2200759 RepID=UPI000DD48DC2|nr:hypothetical protein [Glycomyces dulcitolivorans]